MKKNNSLDPSAKGQFLVYQSEDGRVKIDVRLENETVWLTQQHLAALFQTTKQNISLHLQNIYADKELERGATVKEYLTVQQEGGRSVQRLVEYHNLDAIISVGYRVKSAVATKAAEKGKEEVKHETLNAQARELEETIAKNIQEVLET